jgi:PadR family transcriptional regulator PadR
MSNTVSDREPGPPPLDSIRLDLRRGVLTLAVLSMLRTPHYGYSLRKALNAAGLPVEEGTLYPLVRRLEAQWLLLSHWEEVGGRERRQYRLTPDGRHALAALGGDWADLLNAINAILEVR